MKNGTARVGIRCDVGMTIGVGHLMRTASLAEEMIARGWQVEFCCDAALVSLAEARLAELGCFVIPALDTAPEHVRWVTDRRLDAVVIDSYLLDPSVSGLVVSQVPTLSFVDGPPRGQSASIYVDQNYRAQDLRWEPDRVPSPRALRLAGTEYAVLPDRIRQLRPRALEAPRRRPGALKVLVALGGTDATDVTGLVVAALKRCPTRVDVTVVSHRLAGRSDEVTDSGQRFSYRSPSLNYPDWLAEADLVVSAAGTSLWELCGVGKPIAALAVADNQLDAYRGLTADGVIHGLGDAYDEAPSPLALTDRLTEIVSAPELRSELAKRAYSLVDGLGRVRAIDALEMQLPR